MLFFVYELRKKSSPMIKRSLNRFDARKLQLKFDVLIFKSIERQLNIFIEGKNVNLN